MIYYGCIEEIGVSEGRNFNSPAELQPLETYASNLPHHDQNDMQLIPLSIVRPQCNFNECLSEFHVTRENDYQEEDDLSNDVFV